MMNVIFILIFCISLIDIVLNHSKFDIYDIFFNFEDYLDRCIEELEKQEQQLKDMFKYYKKF